MASFWDKLLSIGLSDPRQHKNILQESFREEISVGGTSLIYRVHYLPDHREVEKLLHPRVQGKPEYEQLQKREKEILDLIQHPLVVESPRVSKRPSIDRMGSTMVLHFRDLTGTSLADLLPTFKNYSIEERREVAYVFLSQLLDALRYLNACGVTHCDLAPENIMVESNGFIKIIDFGVALCDRVERHGFLVEGRTNYQAPEVLENHPHIKPTADLYSAGKIFEAIVGYESMDEADERVFRDLTEDRRIPELPRDFLGLQPIPHLPAKEVMIQRGVVRSTTLLRNRKAAIKRWFSIFTIAHDFAWRHKLAVILFSVPVLTTWLPQVGYLTIDSYPISNVNIVSPMHIPEETIFREVPVRKLPVTSGTVEISFVIPSFGNAIRKKVVTIKPGEHLKVFESWPDPDTVKK